jgi:hypothetical protein
MAEGLAEDVDGRWRLTDEAQAVYGRSLALLVPPA